MIVGTMSHDSAWVMGLLTWDLTHETWLWQIPALWQPTKNLVVTYQWVLTQSLGTTCLEHPMLGSSRPPLSSFSQFPLSSLLQPAEWMVVSWVVALGVGWWQQGLLAVASAFASTAQLATASWPSKIWLGHGTGHNPESTSCILYHWFVPLISSHITLAPLYWLPRHSKTLFLLCAGLLVGEQICRVLLIVRM